MARQAKAAKETEEPIKSNQKTRSGVRKWIEPSILMLLMKQPTHGYDLANSIKELDINEDKPDFGTVYRTLRGMEDEGLIKSEWVTEGPGPAKRNYKITPKGTKTVGHWTKEVEKDIDILSRFLIRLKQFTPDKSKKRKNH
ncbi:MAG: PadR family transcriptional regulator [Firmicutes bacterium]|nr:PadR family transcriptional regulator [Bacillota bacterium]